MKARRKRRSDAVVWGDSVNSQTPKMGAPFKYASPDEAFKAARTDTNPNTIPFNLGGNPIDAIGFGLGKRIEELSDERKKLRDNMEMVFALDENEFNGRTTPQLVIKDLK